LIAVMIAAACGPQPSPRTDTSGLPVDRPVTVADLARIPVGRLFFPGSTQVKPLGASQTPTRPGEEPNPAYSGAILVVVAAPEQMFAWYQSQLAGRGFRPADYYRLADQTSGQAWQIHHRVQVQVAVLDPALLEQQQGVSVAVHSDEIVYEAIVVGYPPGLPKD
jgi:hypothetical protein